MTMSLLNILGASTGANPTGPTGTIVLLVVAAVAIVLFIWNKIRKDSQALLSLALLILRVPLGLFIILVSIPKLKGEFGHLGAFAAQSGALLPHWVPPGVGNAYLHAVPWAEVVVGSCLILGLLTRFFGLIATLMIVSFTIAMSGVAQENNPAFTANVIYIAVTMTIMLLGGGRISLDGALMRKKKKA